jgi:hypothetical protein
MLLSIGVPYPRRMAQVTARLSAMWRSPRLLPRLTVAALALGATMIIGTFIYSFLLPVTG